MLLSAQLGKKDYNMKEIYDMIKGYNHIYLRILGFKRIKQNNNNIFNNFRRNDYIYIDTN